MTTQWKRPESVLVIVAIRMGEVLLMERVKPVGFWQSVTGSLEWGESAQHAARRELFEETGIATEPEDCHRQHQFLIVPPGRERYAPEVRENLEYVFRVILPERTDIKLNPSEHSRSIWLSCREAISVVSSWTNREALQYCVPHCQYNKR